MKRCWLLADRKLFLKDDVSLTNHEKMKFSNVVRARRKSTSCDKILRLHNFLWSLFVYMRSCKKMNFFLQNIFVKNIRSVIIEISFLRNFLKKNRGVYGEYKRFTESY